VVAEGGGVGEHPAHVAEIGPDRVHGQVALGGEVPLVGGQRLRHRFGQLVASRSLRVPLDPGHGATVGSPARGVGKVRQVSAYIPMRRATSSLVGRLSRVPLGRGTEDRSPIPLAKRRLTHRFSARRGDGRHFGLRKTALVSPQ
jgi:hypothetical protein